MGVDVLCVSVCVHCMKEIERCVCENIMTIPSAKVRGSVASGYIFVIYKSAVNKRTAAYDCFNIFCFD